MKTEVDFEAAYRKLDSELVFRKLDKRKLHLALHFRIYYNKVSLIPLSPS